MNFEIIKLNLNNYDLSNYIWDMKNCEFTKLFTEQVAKKIVNHIYLNMTVNTLQAVIWCLIMENIQKKAKRFIYQD